jgi:DNA repair protein RadD
LLTSFPRNFFDLVLVDEAHHAEALTYRLLREHFCNTQFIYFTGTPYRSDHQLLRAQIVYSCTMKESLHREVPYIKHLCYAPLAVEKLTLRSNVTELSFDGFDEVVKGASEIAPVLSRSDGVIVDVLGAAMKKLRELRTISGVGHQAILQASDMSEAGYLVLLWKAHPDNFGTAPLTIDVVHSRLDRKQNNDVMKRLDEGTLDAIVHVGMLGEGFDCPRLSVCCIFKRFGSMAPYVQLLGRVLRRIEKASEADNVAFVIAHPGLGLEKHWELYKKEDELPDNSILKLSGSPSSLWTEIDEVWSLEDTSREDWF